MYVYGYCIHKTLSHHAPPSYHKITLSFAFWLCITYTCVYVIQTVGKSGFSLGYE